MTGLRFALGAGLVTGLSIAGPGCAGGEDVEEPTPFLEEIAIDYPLELWDQDVEGETLLRVRIDAGGVVDSVVVEISSGYPAFDSAAVAGGRELRFDPARRRGERVGVWARVPIRFSKDSLREATTR